MKIRLLSDLHFESHADSGRSFVESLDPSEGDVLVVAGDLITQRCGIMEALGLLCKRFKEVIYVHGNHELWGSNRGDVNTSIRKAERRNPNLHYLSNSTFTLDGRRFVGTPMWFPKTRLSQLQARNWSDFARIRGLERWVYEENELAIKFLKAELREGDILVTHYLPSYKSVHPKWASSSENCFFVCEIDELIAERKPVLALHGHTHESIDYQIESTRVVCNPLGHPVEANPKFDPNLVIEV